MNTRSDRAINPSAARRRFLDAARKEFAAFGYAGASIRSITRSLGMRESAFYAHFKSKQEAYDELFREAGPAVVAALAQTIDTAKPFEQELARLAQHAMRAWTANEARASTSILLREAVAKEGRRRQQMLAGILSALDLLEGKLLAWQKRHEVDARLDARALAYSFITPLITTRLLFFSGASSSEEQRRGRHLVERHIDNFFAMIREAREE